MANATFLTAEWRKLAIANYTVPPQLLERFLPAGTELDLWQGSCYISLVGFMFLHTRLKGFLIPCHAHFEEVNLRFYVRHNEQGVWKRGVVFIREIVPRPALALVANKVYRENYQTLPMTHNWLLNETGLTVSYQWKKRSWNSLEVKAHSKPQLIEKGSEEEFITEHYWGYTKLSDSLTAQYEVQHPKWMVYPVRHYVVQVDFKDVYGETFSFLSQQKPKSVMLAEGSPVAVQTGSRFLFHRE